MIFFNKIYKVKTISFVFSVLALFVLFSFFCCSKATKNQTPFANIDCVNLITDTAGTNDSARVFMPNAFLPYTGGMYYYDFYRIAYPVCKDIINFDFKIFDSKNRLIFATTNQNAAWDGETPYDTSRTSYQFYYQIQTITKNNHKIGICGDLYRLYCLPNGIDFKKLTFRDQITDSGFTNPTKVVLDRCQ